MTLNKSNSETGQKLNWFRFFYLFALVLAFFLAPVAGKAEKGRPTVSSSFHGKSQKLSADLANFPLNADGTVSVIIQFNQTPKAQHFADLAARGGKLKFSLEHINGAAYRIPVKVLEWLMNHPDVAYVSPDRPNKIQSSDNSDQGDNVSAVTADVAKSQFSVDGTGIGVAVIDSGVYNHDDLQTSNGKASRIVYSESFIPGDSSTNDAYGHGTHVAGIIAGNGHDSASGYPEQYTGIAPNANIINLRVLDATGSGADSQVIAAIQRAIALKSTYNIRVINLSLGRNIFESYSQDPLCQSVEAAWKAGIVVVVAAGNGGRTNIYGTQGYATIQAPGNDPNVITVGATKTQGTSTRLDDTVASYSSKGPTLIDHIAKPDIVAPGNRIVSLTSPNNSLLSISNTLLSPISTCVLGICLTGQSGKYMELSGTSMATPVVAGAAALMIQKDPTLTPDTIKARMMKTAWKGYPVSSWGYDIFNNGYFSQYDVFTIGAGYLDTDAAMKSTDVVNGGAPSPTVNYNPASGQATLSNSLSITWGNSITWGSSIVWGNSIVWGSNAVLSDSIIWGNSIVWGQSSVTGNSIIWGQSITAGSNTITGLSDTEDGEN